MYISAMLIFSKIFLSSRFNAMAIWPFIFLKDKKLKHDEIVLNHEEIHLKQQIEMLLLLFFIWYVLEFIVRLFIHKNWMEAYHNISFEREAYANEQNLTYIRQRKFWNFLKYV